MLIPLFHSDRREKSASDALALVKQDEKQLSSAELIPQEILMTIFAHLSPKELISCSAICRRWREVALRLVDSKMFYHLIFF